MAEAVIDGIHRHQAGSGGGIGDHRGRYGRVGSPQIRFDRLGERPAPHEGGGCQGHAQALERLEVFAEENARKIEPDVLQFVGEGVTEGVDRGGGDGHGGWIPWVACGK